MIVSNWYSRSGVILFLGKNAKNLGLIVSATSANDTRYVLDTDGSAKRRLLAAQTEIGVLYAPACLQKAAIQTTH